MEAQKRCYKGDVKSSTSLQFVSQSRAEHVSGLLDLQVTVGCGKVCLFYVGGCAESTMDGGVPRWEFFIGDRPHHPEPDADGRRPPIAQVTWCPFGLYDTAIGLAFLV